MKVLGIWFDADDVTNATIQHEDGRLERVNLSPDELNRAIDDWIFERESEGRHALAQNPA